MATGLFIGADANETLAVGAQVDAGFAGSVQNGLATGLIYLDGQGVKVMVVLQLKTGRGNAVGQNGGLAVNASGNPFKTLGPVPHGVEARHDGQQGLGRADVAHGLLDADMLLAGLQRHAQGNIAMTVFVDANYSAGHVSAV